VVAEAIGRQKMLNVDLIFRRVCIELVNHIAAGDLLLNRKPLFRSILGRGGRLASPKRRTPAE
jgi:hypothetical protein